jgi:hypothetical protein
MAAPATIRSQLTINMQAPVQLQYNSLPAQFQADMSGLGGPCPGQLLVPTSHIEPDFSQIVNNGGTTGLVRIINLDDTNIVYWGLYDSTISKFLPVGKFFPGEGFVWRFSEFMGEGLRPGPGTGTSGTDVIKFSLKADIFSCQVVVDCFAE